jgi:methyl-accepting chemotaxis protein
VGEPGGLAAAFTTTNMDEKLTIFIAITSAAVVLQMLILAGIFFAVRKLTTNLTTVTEEMKTQTLPLLEDVKKMQADLKRIMETSTPKVELILDNIAGITTRAHGGISRVESTLNDVLDRARLQIIRADEMVTRAMDQLEETTEKVAHSVTSPVKHASGVVQGVRTGFGAYFGQKRARKRGPSDEMFI